MLYISPSRRSSGWRMRSVGSSISTRVYGATEWVSHTFDLGPQAAPALVVDAHVGAGMVEVKRG